MPLLSLEHLVCYQLFPFNCKKRLFSYACVGKVKCDFDFIIDCAAC